MEYLPGLIVVVMVIGGIWARRLEKRDWNNGVCADTGCPWISFDMDSQGGRGYKSMGNDGQYRYTWISYAVDKNYLPRKEIERGEVRSWQTK